MQNAHHEDLQTGKVIDKSKFTDCRYVKSTDLAYIEKLERDGFEIINDDDSSDLTLMGKPIVIE